MPHYRDGTAAKPGDVVMGKLRNTDAVVVGTVVQILSDADTCNCRVAYVTSARGEAAGFPPGQAPSRPVLREDIADACSLEHLDLEAAARGVGVMREQFDLAWAEREEAHARVLRDLQRQIDEQSDRDSAMMAAIEAEHREEIDALQKAHAAELDALTVPAAATEPPAPTTTSARSSRR